MDRRRDAGNISNRPVVLGIAEQHDVNTDHLEGGSTHNRDVDDEPGTGHHYQRPAGGPHRQSPLSWRPIRPRRGWHQRGTHRTYARCAGFRGLSGRPSHRRCACRSAHRFWRSFPRVKIGGRTREGFTVNEHSTGQQYRFVLPGPQLTFAEQAQCLDELRVVARSAEFVVASGSLPPEVPANY